MTDRKGMTINKEDFQNMPGWFPVPESKLPVLLPETEDYLPDGSGKSPLARIPEFAQTKCPYCGGVADRETDVSDTFLDSSWYFLRYPSVNVEDRGLDIGVEGRKSIIEKDKIYPPSSNLQPLSSTFHHQSSKVLPWDPEITRKWLPVDMYIGGQEHAVLHLMYARFVAMALHDMGYIDFDEPYTRFFAHGLMIKEGFKMSKSRGNVVNPVKYLDLYGSDCLRMYVLFMGPYDQKMDFRDSGIDGMYRFLGRVYTWVQKEISNSQFPISNEFQNLNDQIKRKLHRTIKEVGEDIEKLHFNTAIAKLMELLNEATKPGVTYVVTTSEESLWIVKTYLKLLAPFAPFISEELWQVVTGSVADFSATSLRASPPASARKKSSALSGTFPSAPPVNNKWSIHQQSWPIYDENLLYEENVTIVVQVNGKVRDTFQTEYRGASNQKQVEGEAKKSEKIQKYLEGKKIIKIIFIPGKVVNFVVE